MVPRLFLIPEKCVFLTCHVLGLYFNFKNVEQNLLWERKFPTKWAQECLSSCNIQFYSISEVGNSKKWKLRV